MFPFRKLVIGNGSFYFPRNRILTASRVVKSPVSFVYTSPWIYRARNILSYQCQMFFYFNTKLYNVTTRRKRNQTKARNDVWRRLLKGNCSSKKNKIFALAYTVDAPAGNMFSTKHPRDVLSTLDIYVLVRLSGLILIIGVGIHKYRLI